MVLVAGLGIDKKKGGGLTLEEMGIFLINKIYREDVNGKARLIFDVTENGQPKQTFFEVEQKYGEFLCHERCDAIVIGLLSYAMRSGCNIKSNVPITEELLYNLNEYLIPALTKYDAKLTAIKIDAPTAEAMPNAGAVGTGLSCGVDSFHTILSHTNTPYKSRNLTHLVINNAGSFNNGLYKEGARDVCYERARKVARELNLPLVETDSNFHLAFPIKDYHVRFFQITSYAFVFAIHCLQKLWKTFHYASSYELADFRLKNNSDEGSAHYDIFSLNCFSTDKLRLYSGGAVCNRLEKVAHIADNEIVQENLHVCLQESHNCGWCDKCRRTIMELYAVGKLEKFGKVFDLENFKKNKNKYLRWLQSMHLQGDTFNEPTYLLLKHEIKLRHKIVAQIGRCKILRKIAKKIFSEKAREKINNNLSV